MIVTDQSHPALFRAFQNVDLDNGVINRLEPARVLYEVPSQYEGLVADAEHALASLSDEDMDTACAGEQGDMDALLAQRPALAGAMELLNAYFDGWPEQ